MTITLSERIERIYEAFLTGKDEGSFPSSLICSAYGRATLSAVGSDAHSEMQEDFEKVQNQYPAKPSGVLEKISYALGYAIGYL
ncbi:hypothetical protein KY308_00270 [Candidatus Woesearchaeota archaeon]|nr:hypothetical protein [Candidatus Woesearchaeota archaeon]